MPDTGTTTTPDGYSMQETGQIPYNPYNEMYGMTSPYYDFMMAGYNPEDTSWENIYEDQGMGAFEGTGILDYDPELDSGGFYNEGDTFGTVDSNYNPDEDFASWQSMSSDSNNMGDQTTISPSGPGPALPEPPMPPWMQNLASGQAYGPWSLIYNNPTPFASKEQWQNMNDSERRGLIGSLPEYQRQDYLDNMQKAFIGGVDKNSSQGFIA